MTRRWRVFCAQAWTPTCGFKGIRTGDSKDAVEAKPCPRCGDQVQAFRPREHEAAVAERYPEHEKLSKVKDQSQVIGEFLDFSKFTLCEERRGRYYPTMMSIQDILADWFGIDSQRLEDEKRQMLDEIRSAA